jgi:nucleoside-diphosphate-sugar epimerase
MRVLLTGGTGYLGRAIARSLARRGHPTVIFARSAHAAVQAGLPGQPVDGDVRDAEALAAAAAGCDALCHTAALVSVWRRRPADFDQVNVGGLRHALAAAARHEIRRLVYTSSFLALPPSGGPSAGRPLNGNQYQRSKLVAERVAAAAVEQGAPLIRLYPGVIYGSGEATEGNLVSRLIDDHLHGRLPGIVGGERIWSFAHVDDVAEAHVEALERGRSGAAYALGGENEPQARLFEIVRELTGRPLPRRIPISVAYLGGVLDEVRAKITGATPMLTRGTVEVLRNDWALDSSSARNDLDYRIRPLVSGLSELITSILAEAASRSSGAPNLQPR